MREPVIDFILVDWSVDQNNNILVSEYPLERF